MVDSPISSWVTRKPVVCAADARATQRAALAGLGARSLFAFITVFVKLANQALIGPSLFVRALFGLVVTNTLQVLMQGGFLAWREPRELRKAFTTWRSSSWVGTLSAMGSACWFTAFALAPVDWSVPWARWRSSSRCCSAGST